MSSTADANLARLGLPLPPAARSVGLFKGCVIVGNLAFVSGHIPFVGTKADGSLDFYSGKVGVDRDGTPLSTSLLEVQ